MDGRRARGASDPNDWMSTPEGAKAAGAVWAFLTRCMELVDQGEIDEEARELLDQQWRSIDVSTIPPRLVSTTQLGIDNAWTVLSTTRRDADFALRELGQIRELYELR